MHSISRFSLLIALCAAPAISHAQETATDKAAHEAKVKARLAEHAQEKAAPKPAEIATSEPEATKEETESVTMMERVIVNNSRITELDVQIKKLDKKITRAKKKLKPSDLDETINSDKIPAALLIFGGKTAGQRRSVAAERVDLMEAERDILEAMKYVRTKGELKQLETQLNAFKTMELQLDEVLR